MQTEVALARSARLCIFCLMWPIKQINCAALSIAIKYLRLYDSFLGSVA